MSDHVINLLKFITPYLQHIGIHSYMSVPDTTIGPRPGLTKDQIRAIITIHNVLTKLIPIELGGFTLKIGNPDGIAGINYISYLIFPEDIK